MPLDSLSPATDGTVLAPDRPGHRVPALVVAVASAVGVWALWRGFVLSTTGRAVDEAAFWGAEYGRTRLWQLAEPVLDVISVPFIAGVLLATMLLAVLRRRAMLAVQVAVLMGGANLTTQLLKNVVLHRPDVGLDDRLVNTLPSGHTTAAASVAAALLLVVPRRVRPAAAVLGAVYTAATGISTLVGKWHRPSDVVAAMLVVLAWAGLATALAARPGGSAPEGAPARPQAGASSLVVSVLGAAGAVLAVPAVLALQRSQAGADAGLDTRAELLTAYGGGALGVAAASCLAFAVLLALRASADPHPPRRPRASPAARDRGVRG